MKFSPTTLQDACLIDLEFHADDRGTFARTFCEREFAEQGLVPRFVQCNTSFNHQAGTLRGMHFQAPPHEEVKLVRCTGGAVYDVIIDLRPASPTYLRHFGVELTAANGRSLYIPAGMAHGFVTLSDNSTVYYQMSAFYQPGFGRGVRWNDPVFGIEWPVAPRVIHERDRDYADYLPTQADAAIK